MTNSTDRRNGLIGELGIKKPVRVATTENITLSGLQTIDGITVVEDDRVLVKNQTTASENGIYDVSSGSWTRSLDFDGNQDVTDGTLVYIRAGTTQLKQIWAVSATNPITIGTTSISFIYVISFGDAGLVAANNLSDVPNKSTARTNLGLAIGTDVQAYDADLATLAGLSSIVNLTALAGLTGAADKVPYFTGAGALALSDLPMGRNAIINGDFNIWQRGTSFSSVASGTYTADRWEYSKSGAMVHDITRSTDVPTVAQAGRLLNYSVKVDCTTIDGSIGSTDICYLSQKVEGYNFLPLAQKASTISFWVKATKTGTYCVAISNSVDRSLVSEITINASDTWEYKTISLLASPSGGTWDYTNGVGLKIFFVLAAGSNFHTTKDAWQTGIYVATSSQVNACDSTSNNFFLCGAQFESGSVATPFQIRSRQEEIELCQRYYRKSYNIDTAPATGTGTGTLIYLSGLNSCADTYPFSKNMRSDPTIRYWDLAGNLSKLTANNVNNTSISSGVIGASESHLYVDVGLTVATDKTIKFHFDATSEL